MLNLNHVSFEAGSFKIDDITLELNSGEYFVLMGPTGSGKSLLIKAVCGIIPIQMGSISIGDKDITNLEPRLREIGYVPQNSSLFPNMSVLENIIFPLTIRRVEKKEAQKKLEPIIDSLGIAALLERGVENLSGGEQQKVALARAVSFSPKLLILDEPVSALDEPTRCEICNLLKTIHHDLAITTIHICHNLEEAKIVSDRVAIISEGKIVQTDTIENLTANPTDDIVKRILRI